MEIIIIILNMRKLRIIKVKTNLTKILNTVLRAGIQIQGNSIPNT